MDLKRGVAAIVGAGLLAFASPATPASAAVACAPGDAKVFYNTSAGSKTQCFRGMISYPSIARVYRLEAGNKYTVFGVSTNSYTRLIPISPGGHVNYAVNDLQVHMVERPY
ncbi:hypothetical protein YW5DRAFT_05572 [Streptomyces sp. Ncost-T6T-1]|uniref:hypothetical protein n=1 Tax=Streptomyces sp. Ncost-T6T-1 TaxID=1100828 RepID=UPI000805990A|nr:hypothetical protein [Streptomyces sp. Ncost-T6T-1]SBU97586.1 hypothetical protein YW5DRAFT_05572 [Streptomyces sp. Ncost-T6T-1]